MIYIYENEHGMRLASVEEAVAGGWVGYSSRNDWHSFQRVTDIATELSKSTGRVYLPVDNGEWVSPRYDVIEAPAIGDEVSYAFNGDSYPCGKIIAITGSYRKITTSEGNIFWRRRATGSWLMDRTWSLVGGHVYKQNPSF